MGTESLAEQLASAARDMQGEANPQTTMDMAVNIAVSQVEGAEEAGVTLVHGNGRLDTPAATGKVVERIDALQIELDQGPCLQALREHRTIYSPDLGTDERWPEWGPRVVEEFGIRSMLCFQLFTNEDNMGALNLYSSVLDGFDDDDRDHGLALAAHAAVAISAAQEIDQLKTAVDTRTTIGTAIGILMERFHLTQDQGFAVLARVSSRTNRKLRDVASELVTTRHLPGLPSPEARLSVSAPSSGGSR